MMPKFRFYVILTLCSGFAFFALYKVLRTEERQSNSSSFEQHSSLLISNKLPLTSQPLDESQTPSINLNPMKNVNELLPITQPSQHLLKQRLREAEVHAKIRESTLKRQQSTSQPTEPIDFKLKNPPKLKHRIIHLDLKGAPPSLKYYSKFFPLIKKLTATGVLIEYEDMFPFYDKIESFSAYNAYKREDINEILYLAKENGLEVIPLIQTFGHLEFILKQPQFMHLREVPEYPQVICPTRNESSKILREMIDQVVKAHPNIKWIHIGADEVYYLGRCEKCQERLQSEKIDLDTLFIRHVIEVAKYIKETHAIQPIMWDDMFRSIPEEYLRESEIHKYVELMVWKYTPNVEEKITTDIWEKYSSLFNNIWAASAFKGATRADSNFPNVQYHLENHLSWMKIISENQDKINFHGIALTGWQRYDHFALLCELLPTSIPSLALNLLYLKSGSLDDVTFNKTREILDCKRNFNISEDFVTQKIRCNFTGSKIFVGVQRLINVQSNLNGILNNNHFIGWVTDYHVKMKFGSPAHVEIGTRNLSELITNTTLLYTYMENALPEVYDTYTTREWLEINLNPIIMKLKELKNKVTILLRPSIWPRRPLLDPGNKINAIKELAILNRQIDL